MNKRMTRNALTIVVALCAAPASSFATAISPVVQGLGGAGRAGVAKESVFTNPASAALLTGASGFVYFQKPSIPDFDAGGRAYAIGISDGGTAVKGSFAYLRSSKARLKFDGTQGYEDRTEFRFASGFGIGGNVLGGLATRYVTRRDNGNRDRFFQADAGLLFPLFSGIKAGLTYENVFNREDELPPTLGAGAQYALGFGGISIYADGYRLMDGARKGERGYALAAESAIAGDLAIRAGRFMEGFRRIKGWSAGLSYKSDAVTFEYSFRVAGRDAKEKDHTFGITAGF